MAHQCAMDIFLSFHERAWFTNCLHKFKPVVYRRYVDDTFLLFRFQSHIPFFLNYLNSQHNSIQFTHEIERSHTVPFLDVLVTKSSVGFKTGLHRKPTVTGLGFKFDSAVTDFLQI